ncbi:hypothetical protein EVAR_48712_1 [Eumeta japonica]|uniref:Uncharacterized protein n=1 Tax=Eumeta variegata TaxID=151549 RepID=A0A4C1XBW9_EUMVA|nr:hypothetical protein EVAR_48712_1 [Eumeta japonica]
MSRGPDQILQLGLSCSPISIVEKYTPKTRIGAVDSLAPLAGGPRERAAVPPLRNPRPPVRRSLGIERGPPPRRPPPPAVAAHT